MSICVAYVNVRTYCNVSAVQYKRFFLSPFFDRYATAVMFDGRGMVGLADPPGYFYTCFARTKDYL